MKNKRILELFLALFAVFVVVPYSLTMNNPSFDAPVQIGFPLTFYQYGGLCVSGSTCSSFDPAFLAADTAAAFALSLFLNFFLSKKPGAAKL